MRLRSLSLGSVALSVLAAVGAGATNWANWRGPAFNGSAEARGLPVRFSPTENVAWSAALPGPSAATPIIWGDRVFLSSTDTGKDTLIALCLDRKTGTLLWRQDVGTGYRPGGRGGAVALDYRSNYASPSPVTDGRRVVFFYGNGDLAAFSLDGKRLWARNLQKDYGDFCFGWTFSSTPQLFEGRLYCQILQRDLAVQGRGRDGSPSILLALDPASGKELWRVERPTPAKMESREAFTTPIPFVHGGRKEILLAGGNLLTGHDPATGKELWRWGTYNPGHNHPTLRLVPSPVAGAGVILVCAPKRLPVYAIRAGQSGTLAEEGLAWVSDQRSALTSDVPTPAFYRGRFFVLSDLRKAISSVDPATGKKFWTTELPGPAMCWGSPTAADGKIYCISLKGEVHVLDAGTGRLLASNPMAGPDDNEIRSTIAVAANSLFVRTNDRLYCIAAPAPGR